MCSKYNESSTDIPYECYKEQWKKAGCVGDPKESIGYFYDIAPEYRNGLTRENYVSEFIKTGINTMKQFIDYMFDTSKFLYITPGIPVENKINASIIMYSAPSICYGSDLSTRPKKYAL